MTSALEEQLDKEIRKQIESTVKCENLSANDAVSKVCYSKAEKQSNSGMMHNARILFLYAPDTFGYANKLDDKVKLPLADRPLPSLKQKIATQNIVSCPHSDKVLEVKYRDGTIQKSWKFRFPNPQMASKWAQLIASAMKDANLPKQKIPVPRLTPANKSKPVNVMENPLLQTTPENDSPNPAQQDIPRGRESTKKVRVEPQNQGAAIKPDQPTGPNRVEVEESTEDKERRLEGILNEEIEKLKRQQQQLRNTVPPEKLRAARANWNYKYIKASASQEEEHALLQQFKSECKRLASLLIDELAFPKQSRRYMSRKENERESSKYVVDGIKFILFFSALVDRPGQEPIYECPLAQVAMEEFENSRYIFQHCSSSQEYSVGLPLSCLLRYKGVLVFCKSQLLQESETARLEESHLKECLNALTKKTRIDSSIYQSTDVSKMDYTPYIQADNNEMLLERKFVIYYLEQVSYYLPGQLPEPQHGRLVLRPEILQRSEFSEKLFKGQPNIRVHRDIKDIEVASSRIDSIVKYLVDGLQCRCPEMTNELYVSNQLQFRDLLASQGLHLDHIPLLLEKCSLPQSKKMCVSAMATVAFSKILCSNIQEAAMQEGTTHSQCIEMVVDLLNVILGESHESKLMWHIANQQTQHDFGIQLDRSLLSKHYLLVSLAEEFGLVISQDSWKEIEEGLTHKAEDGLVSNSHVSRMEPVILEAYESKLQLQLQKVLTGSDRTGLSAMLHSLDRVRGSQSLTKKKCYLIRKYQLGGEDIIRLNEIPRPFDVIGVHTAFFTLAWSLKAGNQQTSLQGFRMVLEALRILFGEYHPLQSRLFRLMVDSSQHPESYGDALSMAKCEIVNSNRVFGKDHAKTGAAYLSLGKLQLKLGYMSQCLQSFRQACSVLDDAVDKIQEESYELALRADCYLQASNVMFVNNDLTEEFESYCKQALDYYESRLGADVVPRLCRVYGQLYTCYLKHNKQQQLQEVVLKVTNLLARISDPIEFERVYKLVLQESLVSLPPNTKHIVRQIVEQISKAERRITTVEMYSEGYRLLKRLLTQGQFKLKQVLAGLTDAQNLYNQIMNKQHIPLTATPVDFFSTVNDYPLILVWTIKGWLQMFGSQYVYDLLSV